MLLMRSVLRMISRSLSIDNARRCNAINIAPMAPTPAASVGVAKPPRIEPSTAKMSISGGASAPRILPIETLSLSVAPCAGMESGFTIAATRSHSM